MTASVRKALFLSPFMAMGCAGTDGNGSWEQPVETGDGGVAHQDSIGTTEFALSDTVGTSTGTIVGYYGKCLTQTNGGASGSFVVLSTCDGSAAQNWTLNGSGNLVANSGRCLNASGGSSANLTSLILFACNTAANELWSFTPQGQIQGIGGKCVNVLGGSHVDGTQSILWDCNTDSNEKWAFPRTQYDVNLQLVITKPSTGTGFTYDVNNFDRQVDLANSLYGRARVQLHFDPVADVVTRTDDVLYNYLRSCPATDAVCNANNPSAIEDANAFAGIFRGKLVLFITPTGTASFSNSSPNALNFVAFGNAGDWTFITHEVGHYLGLNHTFVQTGGLAVSQYLSNHGNQASAFDGDFSGPRGSVTDTAPDTLEVGATENGQTACGNPIVINGVSFDPDWWNTMSYSPACTTGANGSVRTLSPGQIGIMQATLAAPDRQHLWNPVVPLATRGVAVGSTIDGRPQIFATGGEGRIATFWKTAGATSPFTPWSSFDTLPSPGHIAAVHHSNSLNEVWAISNGTLWGRYQPNAQGSWTSFAQVSTETGTTDVDSAIWTDGRRMMWSVRNGQVYSRTKSTTDPFSAWLVPVAFLDSSVQNFAVATMPNSSGRLHVFEVINGALKVRWQLPDGSWSALSDFGTSARDVAAGLTADGRLSAYAVDATGNVINRTKTTTAWNSAWNAWATLPGTTPGCGPGHSVGNLTCGFTDISVANLQDGTPELFAIRDNAVWTAYLVGSTWTDWAIF